MLPPRSFLLGLACATSSLTWNSAEAWTAVGARALTTHAQTAARGYVPAVAATRAAPRTLKVNSTSLKVK